MQPGRKRLVLIAVLFMLSVGNFFRIKGNESFRLIQFMSVFVIGFLTALLIVELSKKFGGKTE